MNNNDRETDLALAIFAGMAVLAAAPLLLSFVMAVLG